MNGLGVVRIAWRLLRADRRDLLFFVACIMVSVVAMTSARVTAEALQRLVLGDARAMLAGDLRLQASQPFADFVARQVARPGRALAEIRELNANIHLPGGVARPVLVELKAVDAGYPLRGQVTLTDGQGFQQALIGDGAVVEAPLLVRLGVAMGDAITIGTAKFVIRGILAREPDRVTGVFSLGPRIFIPLARLSETGLMQPGSRVRHIVTVRLGEEEGAEAVATAWGEETARRGIRLLTPTDNQPMVRRYLERFSLYVQLGALLTLLVGAAGIAGSMHAWLREQRSGVAICRSLGASSAQISGILLVQAVLAAAIGSILGAIGGIFLPGLLFAGVGELVGGRIEWIWSWRELGLGSAFGVVAGVLLTWRSLLRVRNTPPARLFRPDGWEDSATMAQDTPWPETLLLTGLAAAVGGNWRIALIFTGISAVVLLGFHGVIRLMLHLLVVQADRRPPGPGGMSWRLAIRHLSGPASGTTAMITALGVGLAVMMTIFLLEGNFAWQVASRLPERAPSFYFIDLQPDQLELFRQISQEYVLPNIPIRLDPVIRGRLTGINGQEATLVAQASQADSWRLQREYVLTWSGDLPGHNRIKAGGWWSDAGQLAASVEAEMAGSLGLHLGDTLTFDIQGTPITAPITSIRQVDWAGMGLNYFVIFSPGVLRDAPMTYLATVATSPEREESLYRQMNEALPNVTAIPSREVLETASQVILQIGRMARVLAGLVVVAAVLTLGAGVAAVRRRRARQSAVCRLLGATRGELTRMALAEFFLLGLPASLLALLVAQGVNAGLIYWWLGDEWQSFPGQSVMLAVGGLVLTVLSGWISSRRELHTEVRQILQQD